MKKLFKKKKKAEMMLSKKVAYWDDSGIGYCGLAEYELIFKHDKEIYIFDNHNIALYPFLEISEKKNKIFDIVHIDAHRDNAVFQYKIPKKINFENIEWCLKKTRVSDYLDLASKTKLIGKIHNITQSWEFKDFRLPKNNFILNLDIDIFGKDGEMVNDDLKRKVIKKAWKEAAAVCIATSPGFIEQKKAKKLILNLLN